MVAWVSIVLFFYMLTLKMLLIILNSTILGVYSTSSSGQSNCEYSVEGTAVGISVHAECTTSNKWSQLKVYLNDSGHYRDSNDKFFVREVHRAIWILWLAHSKFVSFRWAANLFCWEAFAHNEMVQQHEFGLIYMSYMIKFASMVGILFEHNG